MTTVTLAHVLRVNNYIIMMKGYKIMYTVKLMSSVRKFSSKVMTMLSSDSTSMGGISELNNN